MEFAVPADSTVKLKESEKKDNWKKRIEKSEQHESDVYTNYNSCSWYSH